MPVTLDDAIPPDQLAQDMADGYIRRHTHPELPLSIYTYTNSCAYAEHWTTATRLCRGLIVDDQTGEIVAWPFPKFFNYHDHDNGKPYAGKLPVGPFEVYDKIDGSLGILFHYRGRWHVATKGSFDSDQARWAKRWIDDHAVGEFLTPGRTYLTEITYPENRIVVRYHGPGTLVLLGAYDQDGTELPLAVARNGWDLTGGKAIHPLRAESLDAVVRAAARSHALEGTVPLAGSQHEGWVVRFASGLRVKFKTADYIRLHGLLSRTSPRTIWEALAAGTDPAALLDTVPDEFRDWVDQLARTLRDRHTAWTTRAKADFDALGEYASDRKAFAQHAVPSPYKAALFRLLDGHDINELAWRAVRPDPTAPDDPPNPWSPRA
ncbi:T4 RnlA family RNA ligase [Yinghuangia sp. ASG 101]|uniref:T4 RnlA family RNA ligase n=1 Tax=Yinghuangia sp. ASG 101 TaxID=2896848 RepID=UPI001E523847|nr:T4 RnlA family RNA ligase [Yinghuangia sp. ASG 101]UGQ12143.1 T4 RnlA family RNA ligase [Yinghuangia sp. ASG 101]